MVREYLVWKYIYNVFLVEELYQGVGGEGGFVGILNEENEILQAAVRRTKAIVIARKRKKNASNIA
jgi:hypothetical protein